MSETSGGSGWWLASDGRWYPPEPSAPVPGWQPGAVPRNSLLYAGYGSRVVAYLLDLVALAFGGWILSFVGAIIGSQAATVLLVVAFAFWYEVWRVAKNGGTWGMGVMGIRVAERATGRHPVDLGRAVLRALAASLLGVTMVLGILDLLWPLWDGQHQTIHDKVASTVVLRTL